MSEVNPLPHIVVGQVLYCEESRRNAPFEIKEYTVKRIGKKYFYLDGHKEKYPVDKDTLFHNNKEYSQFNFQLYRDKQEILDRREKYDLYDKLRKHFDWSGNIKDNTLEQLRLAVEILQL